MLHTARMPRLVGMARLVGRTAPLATLQAALTAGAVSATGAVLLVSGEPGIGKTRLVAELTAIAPCPVLTGHADPEPGAPPLWPWLQALAGRPERDALGTIGAADPPRTADPATAALLARATRTLAFDAVLDGLTASAAGTGLVVVLEDLHWADEATLALLGLAAGRPGLVLVGTYRSTEQGPALRGALTGLRRREGTTSVTLRPWVHEDVTALLPPGTDPSWAPVLLRAGGGVPLHVTTLLTSLLDAGRSGQPAPPDGSWPLGVPDDLADAAADRLARLDPAARFAVEVAALTGPGCTPDHLLLLAEGPWDTAAALAACEAAVAGGLLVGTGPLSFGPAHALLREAVHAGLPAVRRLRWHARLADAVEAGALPGDPVTHRLRAAADPSGRAAAVRACRTAAATAAGSLAFDRAIELLDTALALPGSSPEIRTALGIEAAEAEFAAGRTRAAVARALAVARDTTDPAVLVRAALAVRGIGGPHNTDIVRLCDTALQALPAGDDAGRARVLAQRAQAAAETGGWVGLAHASAEALATAERSGDPAALADALRARQHAVSGPDGVTERLALARRMVEISQRGGPPDAELWGRLWRIDASFQLGAVDVVDVELGRLDGLSARLGWPIAHWHRHRMRAARLLLSGRFDEAEACADLALAAARLTEDHTAIGVDSAFRSESLRLRGRVDVAVELLRKAGGSGVVVGRGMPIFWANAGLNLIRAGEADEGHRYYELLRPVVRDLPRDGLWLPTVLHSGEIAAAAGDDALTGFCLVEATPYATHYIAGGSGAVRCDGSVSRVLGVLAAALGRTDEAERRFTDAVTMDDRIGALPYRVLSEIGLARLLAARDRERATGLARRAADTARRIGMATALTDAEAVLAGMRERPAVALTARERDVLARMAEGRTNRQIAAELVLSERTVETHVAHVLGKLGVANRAEAAVWAARNT